jgi:hypothetical protein
MDKGAIAVWTGIVLLYLSDAAFFNRHYFAALVQMVSDLYAHF